MGLGGLLQKEEQLPVSQDFEQATQQVVANFKPNYDNKKTMYENGKDLIKTVGIRDALNDEDFRQENKEKVKENIMNYQLMKIWQ